MNSKSTIIGVLGTVCVFIGHDGWAYGGGSSAASCTEPSFYDETPARNAVVPQLSEVTVVASANTDLSSLEFEVGPAKVQPQVVTRRSGEFELTAKLGSPWQQPGKVRIAINAKSKDGCAGYLPYFIEVKPGAGPR